MARSALPGEQLRASFERVTGPEQTPEPKPLPPNDVLGYGPIADDLDLGKLGLIWGEAYVFADHPDKPFEDQSDGELLETSVTYNVFEAARRLGIKDIVWAASEVGIGVPFDKTDAPYVPVDEDYPMRGYNVYALTKVLGEEMARQFCLNDPEMRITCLRLPNVMDPQEYARFEGWQGDPTRRLWNMWTYIDNRDAAQAIECAIRYEARGKDAFLITNDETVMRTPTAELLDRHFPKAERRKAFTGNEVILSNEKAKRVLGFAPTHRWTDEV